MEPCLSIMQTLSGVDTHYCNYSNRKCSNFICLYPHGSLSLCDSLPFAEFSFSRLQERKTKMHAIMPLLNECSRCSIINFCKGGCLGIRYMLKNSASLLNDYCESKKILFEFFSHFIKEVQQWLYCWIRISKFILEFRYEKKPVVTAITGQTYILACHRFQTLIFIRSLIKFKHSFKKITYLTGRCWAVTLEGEPPLCYLWNKYLQ